MKSSLTVRNFPLVGELSTLHTKRLMVNFETDETEQERDIESKTREITEVFHHAEGLLKKFSKLADEPNLTAPERTVRKNMQMSMAKKLQGLSMSFRATQKVNNLEIFWIMNSWIPISNIWNGYRVKKMEVDHKHLVSWQQIARKQMWIQSIRDLLQSKCRNWKMSKK